MSIDIKRSFLLRAPHSLIKALRAKAKRQNLSMNQLCISLLTHEEAPKATFKAKKTFQQGEFSSLILKHVDEVIAPSFQNLIGVVLFGSAARGEMKASSDIDLLIVLKSKAEIDRDLYSKMKVATIGTHDISPLIVALPSEASLCSSLWIEASLDGCILYDTDFIISKRFSLIRSKILTGELVRHLSYGVPYWTHHKLSGELIL